MGLFVRPNVPEARLQRALSDYASGVDGDEVVALYDATLMGTGGDGAVFTPSGVVFQNNDLQAAETIRYGDLVGVEEKNRWFGLGGKFVTLIVNRGRATFELQMDFSGAPNAASYVADFLETAMLEGVNFRSGSSSDVTDMEAVHQALDRLRAQGALGEEVYDQLLEVLRSAGGDEG